MDIYSAYKNNMAEYRIGSVILHKDGNVYNVVDGQQRITTITILLLCFKDKSGLIDVEFSRLSERAIIKNHQILQRKVKEIDEDKEAFKKYLLEKCNMVKIVTDEEQEAFQFFDSQNTRGKELAPHDLLKSFHLREMKTDDENTKIELIKRWESIPQKDLEDLFEKYLFPLTQWYKGENGLGYGSDKINAFKGIKSNSVYNFSIYHKASNLYIEQMVRNGMSELVATGQLNQYQLTQPIIAGKRFFKYTIHYSNLLEEIIRKIENSYEFEEIPSRRSGDIYVKQLFTSSLLFFADRFGLEEINNMVMELLYSWSYSIRIVMEAVYPQTINKYANGRHERINENLNMFIKINSLNTPEELSLINLEDIDEEKYKKTKKKYEKIWTRMEVNKHGNG